MRKAFGWGASTRIDASCAGCGKRTPGRARNSRAFTDSGPDRLQTQSFISGEAVEAKHARTTQWAVLKFGGTSVSRRNRWDTIGRLASKRVVDDDVRVL